MASRVGQQAISIACCPTLLSFVAINGAANQAGGVAVLLERFGVAQLPPACRQPAAEEFLVRSPQRFIRAGLGKDRIFAAGDFGHAELALWLHGRATTAAASTAWTARLRK